MRLTLVFGGEGSLESELAIWGFLALFIATGAFCGSFRDPPGTSSPAIVQHHADNDCRTSPRSDSISLNRGKPREPCASTWARPLVNAGSCRRPGWHRDRRTRGFAKPEWHPVPELENSLGQNQTNGGIAREVRTWE